LKFCDSYGYFCLSQILVILIHSEFGFDDVHGGILYGMWRAASLFWSLLTSYLNDNLGVRKSLLIGFSISTSAMILLLCSNSQVVAYLVLLVISPLGFSIGPPMLYVGKLSPSNNCCRCNH
jgi:MFS family permease